jgi:hypothetical protein
MAPNAELQKRIDELSAKLETKIKYYLWYARFNERMAYAVRTGTILCSVLVAIGAFVPAAKMTKEVVGLIGTIPGVLELATATLKFQKRANWQFRRTTELEALHQRLLYEIPENPSLSDIAKVSSDMVNLDRSGQITWEREITSSVKESEKSSKG